jgi:hypothetical protein
VFQNAPASVTIGGLSGVRVLLIIPEAVPSMKLFDEIRNRMHAP